MRIEQETSELNRLASLAGQNHKNYADFLNLAAGYFRKRLQSSLQADDVEDLVQETLIKIHLNFKNYNASLEFVPWAYRVLKNSLYDYYRKEKRKRQMLEQLADTILISYSKVDDSNRHTSQIEELEFWVKSLPSMQRKLVHLVYQEGLRIKEAAQKLGLSESNAKVSIHRARKLLREKMLQTRMHDEQPA